MSAVLVARRYAKALYKVCNKDLGTGRSMMPALETLNTLFEQEDAGRILRSPAMPLDLKRNLLDYGLKVAGAPKELTGFCYMVVEAGRVQLLPEIIEVFDELLCDAEGTVEARVASAKELSGGDRSTIESLVAGIVGKTVKLNTAVEEDLLGGFVVNVGNFKIDMSLKTRLNGLAQEAAAQ